MQGWREEERGLKEQQRETERWSLKKGGGVKYEQKEILGVSDVICSSCTKARISHMFHQSNRLYQAEQSGVGQLSGLYLLNRDIPESKWMAESGPRDRYHPE